ncbi:MAG TPA: hypothetical protein VFE47_12955 [Tepidisphaeraceae bacterium]|jgi:hypothetical protein|nr:hypothetical protein [Tepidisphaeraceae bacterium]
MSTDVLHRDQIPSAVTHALTAQPVTDLHTHLYAPAFGTPVPNATGQTDPAGLMLWGVDELITYHYLIAEVFRVVPAKVLPYDQFFKMTRQQQADHIWKHLFIERTPISEACRGVITTLSKLGLDPNEKSLEKYRRFFVQQDPSRYVDRVMELANVQSITMTNPVFDDNERARWLANPQALADPRFKAVLRIDPILLDYANAARKMTEWGYAVSAEPTNRSIDEARRFLRDWLDRQQAIYIAASLPPEWRYPTSPAAGQTMLEKVVLPVCAERNIPLALMIGARRGANPALQDAGDSLGQGDVNSLAHLCSRFPDNKFLVTMLSRESQHELCVAARKFGNLMIFGCWWFLNNPSLIEEIERMRFELLGTSFIPQHSDARVLDQLLYKWDHSRKIIARVLTDKYADLTDGGLHITQSQIARDAELLLAGNFAEFLAR